MEDELITEGKAEIGRPVGQKRSRESLEKASEVEWRDQTWEMLEIKRRDMVMY